MIQSDTNKGDRGQLLSADMAMHNVHRWLLTFKTDTTVFKIKSLKIVRRAERDWCSINWLRVTDKVLELHCCCNGYYGT